MTFRRARLAISAAALLASASPVTNAASPAVFDGPIREIFRARCLKCHGDDEQKSDLNLQHYATAMKGGSGGPAILAGKPNSSPLFQSITHADGIEKMPPKSDKIPDAEIALIRAWIAAGAPEQAGSSMRTVAPIELTVASTDRPAVPAMPDSLPPFEKPARLHPVTALASSPWAPLLAQAARDSVHLRHAQTGRSLGAFPFPEGIPYVLRFSRDGARLMAAGGNPVHHGKAVFFDVRTGTKLAQVGDENDAILAADWSPDGRFVALGGSGRTVKAFSTSDGKELYRLRKHTDWITAVAFSPDGRFLATGDRAGGIHLWEPSTGAIALSLSEHKDAIHALAWRGDSRLLASASEDGSVILWDAKDGWPAASINGGHAPSKAKRVPSGVLSIAWLSDGSLFTAGRDRRVRWWSAGGEPLGATDPMEALPTRIQTTHPGPHLWVGDADGNLHRATPREGSIPLEISAP